MISDTNNNDDDNNNNNNKNDNNSNNNNSGNYPVAWKYWVDLRREIAISHGQVKHSSALVGNHLEMVWR